MKNIIRKFTYWLFYITWNEHLKSNPHLVDRIKKDMHRFGHTYSKVYIQQLTTGELRLVDLPKAMTYDQVLRHCLTKNKHAYATNYLYLPMSEV